MKTKAKLSLLVAIVGVVLFLAAIFLAWNSLAIYRTVRQVTPALEALTTLNEVQSQLHRQQHALVNFVVNGDQDSRQEFISCRALIEAKLLLSAPGEKEAEENRQLIRAKYNLYRERAENCIQLKLAGRSDEALLHLDNEVTPYLAAELRAMVERLGRAQVETISADYRVITMKLGALLWVAGAGLEKVNAAISGVEYDLAVSAGELALYGQVNELTEFLLHGETQDWKEFWGHQFEMRRVFGEWHQVIRQQQALGLAGEDEDEEKLAEVQARYEKVLPLLEQAISIRVSLGRAEGLKYVEHEVRPLLDNGLFPTLAQIGKESRAEIEELHGGLLKTVIIGGLGGLSGVILLSVLLVLLALRMSNTIVSSLARLKAGAETIQGGNLEHRIRVVGSDEFSELALSFNAMSASLKEQNAELRAFVFSIAHDLRTPLVNLKGFAGELRQELTEVMPELLAGLNSLTAEERQRVAAVLEHSVPEALGYIDLSTKKLDSLINAVLHVSRIDFQALNPERIDLEGLVQVALQALAHTIKEKNVTVTLGPLPPVVADRLVMEQCIANLLDNACKYLVPGRAGVISITAEQTADEVILYFQDNGRGIAPDDIAKVFEIFRRVGQPDTPGEGMGLAFVKGLAKRQGGRVWCESSLGEGSTFCLAIPAANGKE